MDSLHSSSISSDIGKGRYSRNVGQMKRCTNLVVRGMSCFYLTLLACAFICLLWQIYHSKRLFTKCEDFMKFGDENEESSERKQSIFKEDDTAYCAGDDATTCVPPLLPYFENYRVVDKYQLLGCAMEKNFSTMLSAIFCYLYDEERFVQNRKNLTGEIYHNRFCKDLNEYDSLQSIRKKFDADHQNWTMVAIVRDPLERFVSGFVDKCLREKVWRKFPNRCNRCKTNLTCFMERQYVRMMRWKTVYKLRTYSDFDESHFFPQNWRCEFLSHFHDYHKLHLDTSQPSKFIDELLTILRSNNVSNTAIEYIRSSVQSGRTAHSTVDTADQKQTKELILSNDYLRNLLIRMYYYDFILFGYSIPRKSRK